MTIDEIMIVCATAQAGAEANLAIYGSGADGRPSGTPLVNAGVVDLSTAGIKAKAISLALAAGLYWTQVAFKANSPSAQSACFRVNSALPGFVAGTGDPISGSQVARYYEEAVAYGSAGAYTPGAVGTLTAAAGNDGIVTALRRAA